MESKAKAGAAIVATGTAAPAACFKLNAAPAAALDVETTAKKGSRRRRGGGTGEAADCVSGKYT